MKRPMTDNWGGGGNDEEGGASPDVCSRAPDTLATLLPAGGAPSAPPDPVAGFKGAYMYF